MFATCQSKCMSSKEQEEEGELAMFESKNLATEGFEYSTTLTRCYCNVRTKGSFYSAPEFRFRGNSFSDFTPHYFILWQ